MRQVCFTDKNFIEYLNKNMVVLYGMIYQGKTPVLAGEKVEFTTGYTPFKPDVKIKKVFPFAPPLVGSKIRGLKSNYYVKDIAKDLLKIGISVSYFAIFDCNMNTLISTQDFDEATNNNSNIKPEIFITKFKEGVEKLKQSKDKLIEGKTWRKGFWGTLQAEYYLKNNKYENVVDLLSLVLEDSTVPEKYIKKAKEIKKSSIKEVISFVKDSVGKLKSSKTQEKYLKIFYKFAEFYDSESEEEKKLVHTIKLAFKKADIAFEPEKDENKNTD